MRCRARLHATIRSYGYHDIETPTFEFFDVLEQGGSARLRQESFINFLTAREIRWCCGPDFTPPIARAATKYFLNEPMAVRLTYLGNTFINNSSYQGRLKETTQIGGELIRDDSADADAEVIALVVQTLLASGLEEFQISLGHVGFFRALVQEAGFDGQTTEEFKDLAAQQKYVWRGKADGAAACQ